MLVSGQGGQDQHAAENPVERRDGVETAKQRRRPSGHHLPYVTLFRLIHGGICVNFRTALRTCRRHARNCRPFDVKSLNN